MKCPTCGSGRVRKNGHRRGKQNHRCKVCDRQFIELHSPRGHPKQVKHICLRMYHLGLGVREIEHLTTIPHSTIHYWIKQSKILATKGDVP